jgi:D-lactate dehydrogenase (cytochrome)
LSYLDSHSPAYNKIFRATVIQLGGAAQRLASKLVAPLQPLNGASRLYPLQMLRSSLPSYPSETLRDVLPNCEPNQALFFEPVLKENAAARELKTVFYFPGCGSERLFSDISMATIHMLLEMDTRVVLPPPFLCCGFPAHVNAKTVQHSRTVLRDSILFAQIRDMFSYLDFDACVVTCGTCREGLDGMDTPKLFKRIVDAGAYMLERGLRIEGTGNYLYHAPCHDSLDGKAAGILQKIGGFGAVTPVAHCCSEAGTLSLSRPDITDSMLDRKREALLEVLNGAKATVLTNCPSCLQGLGRLRNLGVRPLHIAVALAEKHSGPEWKKKFLAQASRASTVSF